MTYKMNGPSLYKSSALKQQTKLNTAKGKAKEINALFQEVSDSRDKGDMLTANIANTQAYKIHDDWNKKIKKPE